MQVVGIYRSERYSPNMSADDVAIADAVGQLLQSMGHQVDMQSEDHLHLPQHLDAVFSMARHPQTLSLLSQLERLHITVVNRSVAVACCSRVEFTRKLLQAQVAMPLTHVIPTDTLHPQFPSYPCWVKRGEGYAEEAGDVCFVETPQQLARAVERLRSRAIRTAVVSAHAQGDLVKFYGVEGTTFFRWNYASQGHSKFGLEAVNGKEKGYAFNPERIKLYADMIAKKLNVPIYGGDVIIDEEGEFWFIDFNDFPSFSSCREGAAQAIAKRCEMENVRWKMQG